MAYEDETMRMAAAKAVKSAAPVVSGGVSSRDPEIQAKLAEMSRIKTGDVFRTGLMGAAAGAQAGQGMTNPLAAFVQGAAMGLQVPAQIYEQKQKQIQSVVGATPFGVIVPEAQNPDSPYNILAGLPYDLAVKAIEGIARDTAKLRIEGEQSRAASYIISDAEAQNYSGLLAAAGINLTPNAIKSLRKDDVREFLKLRGVPGGEGEFDKIRPLKDDFDSTAPVKEYNQIKSSVGTINRLAGKVERGEPLNDQEQVLLAREFLNAQSSTGGGRASAEMFDLISNRGWAAQLKDALDGKPINLSPEQAKAIKTAVATKMAEVKVNAAKEAERLKPLIAGKSEIEKKYILGDLLEEAAAPVVSRRIVLRQGSDGKMYRFDADTKENLGAE
jgi:hypothetical protein